MGPFMGEEFMSENTEDLEKDYQRAKFELFALTAKVISSNFLNTIVSRQFNDMIKKEIKEVYDKVKCDSVSIDMFGNDEFIESGYISPDMSTEYYKLAKVQIESHKSQYNPSDFIEKVHEFAKIFQIMFENGNSGITVQNVVDDILSNIKYIRGVIKDAEDAAEKLDNIADTLPTQEMAKKLIEKALIPILKRSLIVSVDLINLIYSKAN
jgi:protoporphyrinogen oxidase